MERALDVIGDLPDTADLRCLLLRNRALGLLNLGRYEEVPAALGAALTAAERSGTVSRYESVRTAAAGTYYDLGRWDDALAELAALADPVVRDPSEYWIRRSCAALIAVHRDDRAALAAELAALPEDPDGDALPETAGRFRVARALSFEAAGRPAEALDAIIAACRRPGSPPDALDLLYDCQPAVPELVRLALAVDRRGDAEAYVRAVEARAGSGLPEAVAVLRHCRGLLGADPDLVEAAVDGYDRIGFVLQRALAHEDHAVLLARRGDLDGAWAAYEAAADTYVALEAAWDLRRAAERLRPFGVRRGRYRIRRRPVSGWEALTPTELKVAALVAKGLSNPDVAARLHVSRRTVETHVAHIITKLGGRSRVDIAVAYATGPGAG
jgi:DNA-binding CsgD family transcriptional regulator